MKLKLPNICVARDCHCFRYVTLYIKPDRILLTMSNTKDELIISVYKKIYNYVLE